MKNENLRDEIISKVIRVPDENLDSIKDYIDFVLEKGKKKRKITDNRKGKTKSRVKKAKSSLEKLEGVVNTGGRLSKNIDIELYGA